MSPDQDIPGFAQITPGGSSENENDEKDILTDQDQTKKIDLLSDDENMGAKSRSLDELDEEPDEFLRGDIDVKEQMDRAADAMNASLHGYESQADEDSPRGDLGASFRSTPGGLEEVEMKTDEELARRHAHDHHHDRDIRTGHSGHPTGALTDIGAGRSGVTRAPDHGSHR